MSAKNYLILAGPPNSGKTTLFNWITGYKRQTVNYPGSTVDLFFGMVHKKLMRQKMMPAKQAHFAWNIVDTPGVYHLFQTAPHFASAEEEVVRKVLQDSAGQGALRGVILVLDSTRLERQLTLAFHLKKAGVPFVIALSMYDLQKKKGSFDLSFLSKSLNVPVCAVEGLLGGGVRRLLHTAQSFFTNKPVLKSLSFVPAVWSEKEQEALLKKSQTLVKKAALPPASQGSEESKAQGFIGRRTRQVDAWLLHPVFGFAFLSAILFAFFSGIFWLASPLMDFIDSGFSLAGESLFLWGGELLGKQNALVDFLAHGVIASFGAFFVFVPQVFILFLGIHLLEDSGYLARAVSLVDGPFSRIGLSGKSLIPFLSGFACAIPAVLSARAIASKRERWITAFVIPLMTCSARLPVYVLLLGFLFYKQPAWKPGICMALLYFLSLLLAVLGAGLLNLFSKKSHKSSFIMELPLYRRPLLLSVFALSWARTRHFIWKAGPVICLFALLMWGAVHFPRGPADLSSKQQIQQSYAGRFGQWIEPAFKPMGADWRVGVSLLSAYAAREVFIPVLAVVLLNTNQQEGADDRSSLLQTMTQARVEEGPGGQGRLLFTTGSVMALLVFFMLSLQCFSTTGIVYKETSSWKFAGLQLFVLNALGWLAAVLTFQLF